MASFKHWLLLTPLTLVLTACPDIFTNMENDGYFQGPGLTASRYKLTVGESVEVTLGMVFGLGDSDFAERPHSGFALGACFSRREANGDVSSGGYCPRQGGEIPLPDWVLMSGSASVVREFDDFVLQRGTERRFEHTFSFTVTQPGQVGVAAVQSYLPSGDLFNGNDSRPTRFVFK